MTYCFDPEVIGPWVNAASGWPWISGSAAAIGKVRNGRVTAGVTYEKFNGASVTMHVAGTGNWLDRRMLFMCFDYPFRQLKVNILLAPVSSANGRCLRFIERLGFTLKATLGGADPHGDLHIYGMTASECRWLKENGI